MAVSLITQDGRSFDSFGVDTVNWLKTVPHSLDKVAVVWAESTIIINRTSTKVCSMLVTLHWWKCVAPCMLKHQLVKDTAVCKWSYWWLLHSRDWTQHLPSPIRTHLYSNSLKLAGSCSRIVSFIPSSGGAQHPYLRAKEHQGLERQWGHGNLLVQRVTIQLPGCMQAQRAERKASTEVDEPCCIWCLCHGWGDQDVHWDCHLVQHHPACCSHHLP